ncbi:MAG: bifunctional precorrin-2 dehydrogenase/sirohydrochlorin ferrochelatase [Saprospiraceae bacterium]
MTSTINKNELFPVFVKMSELNSLIVGGGNVALEKLRAILSNSPGAKIRIIAPLIKNEILELINKFPDCTFEQRPFEPHDLEGKDLIFLTTDDPDLHQAIKAMAAEKNILVNTADKPDLCDFYLSSIVQKGQLKIAISTNGMSPTMAKRIKEMLNAVIPDDINQSLDNLNQIRSTLKGDFNQKIKILNQLTSPMNETDTKLKKRNSLFKTIILISISLVIGLLMGILYSRI